MSGTIRLSNDNLDRIVKVKKHYELLAEKEVGIETKITMNAVIGKLLEVWELKHLKETGH
jgi:hypothetical protein